MVDSESLTGFLGHTKIGGVIGRVSPSDNPQFEPFSKRLFNKFLVIWFEGELLVIHWEIVFEVQAVFVLIASAEVHFRNTDHFGIFPKELQVLGFELLRHIQIGLLLDFLIGHEAIGLGFQLVEELIHGSLTFFNCSTVPMNLFLPILM